MTIMTINTWLAPWKPIVTSSGSVKDNDNGCALTMMVSSLASDKPETLRH